MTASGRLKNRKGFILLLRFNTRNFIDTKSIVFIQENLPV